MATLNIKEYLDRDEQKDLLRFLTAGSVDDGKSTLIGRLLFDSKKLYEDQLDALERDSKRMGNAGDHIDYALLLDGLKAEHSGTRTVHPQYDHRRFDCQPCHHPGGCPHGSDYADAPPYLSGFALRYQACGAGGQQDGPG